MRDIPKKAIFFLHFSHYMPKTFTCIHFFLSFALFDSIPFSSFLKKIKIKGTASQPI